MCQLIQKHIANRHKSSFKHLLFSVMHQKIFNRNQRLMSRKKKLRIRSCPMDSHGRAIIYLDMRAGPKGVLGCLLLFYSYLASYLKLIFHHSTIKTIDGITFIPKAGLWIKNVLQTKFLSFGVWSHEIGFMDVMYSDEHSDFSSFSAIISAVCSIKVSSFKCIKCSWLKKQTPFAAFKTIVYFIWMVEPQVKPIRDLPWNFELIRE